jgi:hypothetical protein
MSDAQSAAGPVIYGIPFALWVAIGAVVFAPLIALVGTLISNHNTRKNLEDQLRHDARQRDLERKMALRREVYVEAASALSHLMQVLGRVTSLQSDLNVLQAEFSADLAKLAKVQMVGSEETVEAVMTCVNAVGPAFLELLMQRMPLMLQRQAIDAETNPAKKAQLLSNQSRAHLAAFDSSIGLTKEIAKLLPNAILAVRKEMDLPLDRRLLEGLWSEQFEKVGQAWARVKEQVKALTGG